MSTRPESHPESWAGRWKPLARAVGLDPRAPLVVALSGGADSVFLMHLLAAARGAGHGPQALSAVHVDHGLRGLESDLDAIFCARLCRRLGVPFVSRRVELDPEGPSLENRARELRYRVLVEEARRNRCSTVVTGHHADDGLETLMMRWIRGSHLPGLAGPRAQLELRSGERLVRVFRPLLSMRRSEVRRLLADHGLDWREDSSNASPRHLRNRVRNVLLPEVSKLAGTTGIDNLFRFGRAVEELEASLAGATAYLAWSTPPWACATRGAGAAQLGGVLQRSRLMTLAAALRRRALWRLLFEGTGLAPRHRLLARILDDLCAGRCTRHTLAGGWSLQLRSAVLELHPPRRMVAEPPEHGDPQARLPFPDPAPAGGGTRRRFLAFDAPAGAPLTLPGSVVLQDGRRLLAELVSDALPRAVPRGRCEVELDAAGLPGALLVRWPRPGDRFHPLGGPGRRPLARFLADAGVPREERDRVPLVFAGDELVWAAGLRPAESRRVLRGTRSRLRLSVAGAAAEAPAPPHESGSPLVAGAAPGTSAFPTAFWGS